jgi:PBSX family phage terminase large subunit
LPAGQPTKFSDETLAKAKDYIENFHKYDDLVPSAAGMACVLGVVKSTLYNWAEAHPEFLDMLESMNQKQEKVLLRGGLSNDFNSTITKLMLSKQVYTETLWTGKYRYAILTGGRGSGKSFAAQTFLRDLTFEVGQKIAATRYTMVSAEKSVIPEFRSKIEAENLEKYFSLNGRTYTNTQSKSELFFLGLKTSSGIQTASLKSIAGLTTWSMEEAEELIDDGTETEPCTFDKIDDSIREKGIQLRSIMAWNPSHQESFVFKRFFADRGVDITTNGLIGDTLYIYTTYLDNIANLNDSFIAKAEQTKITNPERYDHIYMGLPTKSNPNALWKKDTMISPFRVHESPAMQRIVVGVDPSVGTGGDECGIVIAGRGFDGHYYVLDDASAMLSPRDWGRTVAGKYNDHRADRIIAEVNNGGDMVVDTIRHANESLPVKVVHATRGKLIRAEPIAALYEEGKVHHLGMFAEMEQELCTFTGKASDRSPNRMDALVWALTELSTGSTGVDISFV